MVDCGVEDEPFLPAKLVHAAPRNCARARSWRNEQAEIGSRATAFYLPDSLALLQPQTYS
jgi:hypothetical protein